VEAVRRPQTLTDAAVQHLSDAIVRGEIPPGTSLAEVPVAQQLKTSRGTVREALRQLSELGLVEINPHQGARVMRFTPERAAEIFGLRSVLNAYAARLIAAKGLLNHDLLQEMKEAMVELDDAVKSGDRFRLVLADENFHHRLNLHCGNALLLDHLESLHAPTRLLLLAVQTLESDPAQVSFNHRPIMAAIEQGDGDALVEAITEHIESSGKRLLRNMQETKHDVIVPALD
jgi:DNA-binding GntR family transcriptional regulator